MTVTRKDAVAIVFILRNNWAPGKTLKVHHLGNKLYQMTSLCEPLVARLRIWVWHLRLQNQYENWHVLLLYNLGKSTKWEQGRCSYVFNKKYLGETFRNGKSSQWPKLPRKIWATTEKKIIINHWIRLVS